MGRKSRYSAYAKSMNKEAAVKSAVSATKNKSIKNRLQELKEKSKATAKDKSKKEDK